MKSALRFYEKLVRDLEEYRFLIKPYNTCVANKMVWDKHLTASWNVDDLKISCVHKK